MDVKIERMNKGEWGKIRAFFDISTNGFTMKGFKLIQGENNLFVGLPSQKGNDGEYHNTIWCEETTGKKLEQLAITHYSDVNSDMPDFKPESTPAFPS